MTLSTLTRVRVTISAKVKRFLRSSIDTKNYTACTLSAGGRTKSIKLGRTRRIVWDSASSYTASRSKDRRTNRTRHAKNFARRTSSSDWNRRRHRRLEAQERVGYDHDETAGVSEMKHRACIIRDEPSTGSFVYAVFNKP